MYASTKHWNALLEQTDIHTMKPHDALAAGSAKWVLANPGVSYIAYTYNYEDSMGLKEIPAGNYQFTWLDTVTGKTARKTMRVDAETTWNKPAAFGNEIAVAIERIR